MTYVVNVLMHYMYNALMIRFTEVRAAFRLTNTVAYTFLYDLGLWSEYQRFHLKYAPHTDTLHKIYIIIDYNSYL